jgi:hypothetical protein
MRNGDIMKKIILAALLIGATPAFAQTPQTKVAHPPAQNVDPARLALARKTIEYVWPLGTYQRMMSASANQIMDSMMRSMFDMKVGDMVPSGQKMSEEDKKIAQTTMREAILKKDPHFEERMRITNKVMMGEMGTVLGKMEPAIREGLAKAYAKKFDTRQLDDLNGFFQTPTGRVYAAESILLFTDPEMTTAMTGSMPELIKSMPAIMEKVKKATAHLPEPPKPRKEEDADEDEDEGAADSPA